MNDDITLWQFARRVFFGTWIGRWYLRRRARITRAQAELMVKAFEARRQHAGFLAAHFKPRDD